MPASVIDIQNASTHNLKSISVQLPRHALVVVTGVSGSGKSSLVFDTLYAEGQRRYLQTFNAYARQFLDQVEPPPVEHISGLSPAIAIDQKTASNSPRSTVGTVTELTDYLRVLYARVGTSHCPTCGTVIEAQSAQQMAQSLWALPESTQLQVLSPVVRGRKGEYHAMFAQLRKEGYLRVRVDGELLLLDELPETYRLSRTHTHTIEVVMDRLVLKRNDVNEHRLMEALQKALAKSEGYLVAQIKPPGQKTFTERWFSQYLACLGCQQSFGEMAPRLFSFNSPYGACKSCQGTGLSYKVDEARLVPNPSLSLADGAIIPLPRLVGHSFKPFLKGLQRSLGIPVSKPYSQLSQPERALLLYGNQTADLPDLPTSKVIEKTDPVKPAKSKTQRWLDETDWDEDEALDWQAWLEHFEGLVPALKQRAADSSPATRRYLNQFLEETPCLSCHGDRLQPFPLAVTLAGKTFAQLHALSLEEAASFLRTVGPALQTQSDAKLLIAKEPLKELTERLGFLLEVGLGYLSLNRRASTLSGGEAQRIRLASQIGSGLSGVLYVLDEPSIGLHPHNNQQLIATLGHLRDKGNSLVVVEHDEDTMRAADYLVDVGPAAGRLGGQIVASGTPDEVAAMPDSLTAQYLRGEKRIEPNRKPRKGHGQFLTLKNATANNLKNLTVSIPLGTFTCVTGLSGSGKSTLVFDCLQEALRYHLGQRLGEKLEHRPVWPAGLEALEGFEAIEKLIPVDQSPIGRTSRSNPATYTGLMDPLRKLFAACELSQVRGYTASRFSFNVKGGRCDVCQGEGERRISTSVLPEARIACEVCNGSRYNAQTLEVRYKGQSIADVLAMTVGEALNFFEESPTLKTPLQVLCEVGLDYLQLGQPAPTLSGGEAQRLKLATELMRRPVLKLNADGTPKGQTLYLLDEPTIGLHWADLEKLLAVLHRLVDAGHTVVVIEHQSELIASADWVIDLGSPSGEGGGGASGGYIVAQGAAPVIAGCKASLTGRYLKL